MISRESVYRGYAERMKNIFPFATLLELRHRSYGKFNGFDLAFAILLYLLENMLTYGKKNTYDDISRFIYEEWKEEGVTFKEIYDAVVDVIYNHLRNQGRKLEFLYYNWDTGKEEAIYLDLLETEKINFDELREKKMRLVLSNSCIDMLFKTREMFSEYQISITQLFLRQQIQKGVFDGALRTIDELNLSIRSKISEMESLQWEMKRDVLDFSKRNLWEIQIKKNGEQFAREKEVFADLIKIIKDITKREEIENLAERDRSKLENMYLVQRRLDESTIRHDHLFHVQQVMQSLLNELIEEKMFSIFSSGLNIEHEVLASIMDRPELFGEARLVLLSFFNPRVQKWMMANQMFAEQKKREGRGETIRHTLEQIDLATIEAIEQREREVKARRKKQFTQFFRFLFKRLAVQSTMNLSELLIIAKTNEPSLADEIQKAEFVSFLLLLFQEKEILLEVDSHILSSLPLFYHSIVEAVPGKMLRRYRAIEMIPIVGQSIQLENGILVSDFTFCAIEQKSDDDKIT